MKYANEMPGWLLFLLMVLILSLPGLLGGCSSPYCGGTIPTAGYQSHTRAARAARAAPATQLTKLSQPLSAADLGDRGLSSHCWRADVGLVCGIVFVTQTSTRPRCICRRQASLGRVSIRCTCTESAVLGLTAY